MQREILELVDEQYNLDKLIDEMCQAKTDHEILSTARKIIVLKDSAEWLKTKIQMLYGSATSPNGGSGENGQETKM